MTTGNEICERENCGHRSVMHIGGQYSEACIVVRCSCKAFTQTLFANEKPNEKPAATTVTRKESKP